MFLFKNKKVQINNCNKKLEIKASFQNKLNTILEESKIPKVYLFGDISEMTKENAVILNMKYRDPLNSTNNFDCKSETSWQGKGSLEAPVKNYSVKLLNNDGSKFNVQFKDWKSSSGYHLKANYSDTSSAKNIVIANLAQHICDSLNLKLPSNQNFFRVAIDGFPVEMYVNNEFTGIYTWNLKQNDKLYGLTNGGFLYRPQKGYTPTSNFQSWDDSDFEGDNWECRFPDNNVDHTCMKSIIENIFINPITNVCKNNLDMNYLLIYYIIICLIGGSDNISNNITMLSYDGIKWYTTLYDLDIACISMEMSNSNPILGGIKDSTLWSKVESELMNNVKILYKQLRDSNILSVNSILNIYDEYFKNVPNKLFELDQQYKYFKYGYGADFVFADNFDYREYFKQWFTNKFNYADNYWYIEPATEITNIAIEPETVTAKVGDKVQLTVKIEPDEILDKTVTWSSYNEGWATVDENGLVTCLHTGDLIIRATSNFDSTKFVDCNLSIISDSEIITPDQSQYKGIHISNEISEMNVGDEEGIVCLITPYNVFNDMPFTIESSDESIIQTTSVNSIKALQPGTATIKCKTIDDVFEDSITINVNEKTGRIIDESKIFNLVLSDYNIVDGEVDLDTALQNSKNISFVFTQCYKNKYEKIVFPENCHIYVDPSYTINMRPNIIVDLNGSKIEIHCNTYNSYALFKFLNSGTAKIDIPKTIFGELNSDGNVEFLLEMVGNDSREFISNLTIPVIDWNINENNNNELLHYGDLVKFNITLLRPSWYISCTFNIILYKDNSIVNTISSQGVNFSGETTIKLKLPSLEEYDYNQIGFSLIYKHWSTNDPSVKSTLTKFNYNIVYEENTNNAALINGELIGERDTKSTVYSNWASVGSTEGGCTVIFEEGYNNGIENITIGNSIGFNMSSSNGWSSWNSKRSRLSVLYNKFEFGDFDENGYPIDCDYKLRYTEKFDISSFEKYICFGYSLGYHGYDLMRSRYIDYYFYDSEDNFITRKQGKLSFGRYEIPNGSYYLRIVIHWTALPTSGNSDFVGALGFIEEPQMPFKNFIRNCTIHNNYSCGFAACGGQKWIIEGNTWLSNGGRMPACDIDWEDGWEYHMGDVVRNNSFESSYNTIIICAGNNMLFNNNKFSCGTVTVWPRTQNYKFINNNFKVNESLSKDTVNIGFGAQTTRYICDNTFNNSLFSNSNNHSGSNYMCHMSGNIMNKTAFNSGNCSVIDNGNIMNTPTGLKGNVYNLTLNGSSGFMIDSTSISNCTFNSSTDIRLRCTSEFNNCIFTNSYIGIQGTANTGSMVNTFKNCTLTNTNFGQTSWSMKAFYHIENCDITNENKYFLNTRSGYTDSGNIFIVKDSRINLTGANGKGIYITNNFGELELTNNEISSECQYFIYGDNITSEGINKITMNENTFVGCEPIDTKYIDNEFVEIIEG